MSDESEIRRANLRRLCKARQLGIAELRIQAGRNYSFWFELLKGSKSFGEKLARSIEEQLMLPRGWLDQGDEPPAEFSSLRDATALHEQWPFSRELHQVCSKLNASQKLHLENVMRAVLSLDPLPRQRSGKPSPQTPATTE